MFKAKQENNPEQDKEGTGQTIGKAPTCSANTQTAAVLSAASFVATFGNKARSFSASTAAILAQFRASPLPADHARFFLKKKAAVFSCAFFPSPLVADYKVRSLAYRYLVLQPRPTVPSLRHYPGRGQTAKPHLLNKRLEKAVFQMCVESG